VDEFHDHEALLSNLIAQNVMMLPPSNYGSNLRYKADAVASKILKAWHKEEQKRRSTVPSLKFQEVAPLETKEVQEEEIVELQKVDIDHTDFTRPFVTESKESLDKDWNRMRNRDRKEYEIQSKRAKPTIEDVNVQY